ncbi:MAG: serine/threonine-protein phosphatase [Saprospiraceae bacterium]|nr:serine/threonine-protein phosphatase [Saprospiraceae bacterium]
MRVMENDISIISDSGGRDQNQDFAIAYKGKLGTLLIVCDGAGGYNGGAYASNFVGNSLIQYFRKYDGTVEIKEYLINSIQSVNQQLISQSASDPDLQGMKTTLSMVFLDGSTGIAFHIGDSRIYQIRNGNFVFRSKDHSLVQELLAKREITRKEVLNHPKANVITRAMGAPIKLDIEINDLKFKNGDILLLTTDGIHGVLDDSKILKLVNNGFSLGNINERLLNEAEVEAKKIGILNHDNLTSLLYCKSYSKLPFAIKHKLALFFTIFLLVPAISIFLFRNNINVIPNKQKLNADITVFTQNQYLDCMKMDSIMNIDNIRVIHLHRDSFQWPDPEILINYTIDSISIKDTIVVKRIKVNKK